MVLLFDYDSILYLSTYRVISISEIKDLLNDGIDKDSIRDKIIQLSIDRCNQITLEILDDIVECGVEISSVEYFLTTCKKSVRKAICENYKAKRKRNNWVSQLRKALISEGSTNYHFSDQWEADDLIADYAKSTDKEYIICSIDKDLQQIQGYHYNYQKMYEGKGADREYIGRKGLSHTSSSESIHFLATQMLMGDAGDGIQGIKGIGKMRAAKILKHCKNEYSYFRTIVNKYIEVYKDEYAIELTKNYRLLKLGQ